MALTSRRAALWLWSWSLIAFFAFITNILFLSVVAVALFRITQPARGIAITSICLEFISLLLIVRLVWKEASSNTSTTEGMRSNGIIRRHRDILFSSVFALLASAATVATIIWTGTIASSLPVVVGLKPFAVLGGLITTCVASAVALAGLFALLVLSRRASSPARSAAPMPVGDHTTMVMLERPDTSKSVASSTNPFFHPSATFSPSLTRTTNSRSSLRSSFTLPTRSNSMKTAHIRSRPTSGADTPPPSSAFDDWDTSSVAGTLRDSIQSHIRAVAPSRLSTRLAPIPGSRPASPAKPLDGPFLPPSPHPTQADFKTSEIFLPRPPSRPTPARSSPTSPTYPRLAQTLRTPSLHRASSASSVASLQRPNPPFVSQQQTSNPPSPSPAASVASLPATATTNNPSSAPVAPFSHTLPRTYSTTSLSESVSHLQMKGGSGLAEENIHPLFRSCSPIPPPGTTNGTVVVAASIGDALGVSSTEDIRSRAASMDFQRSRAPSAAGGHAPGSLTSPPMMGAVFADFDGGRGSRASSIKGSVKGSIREEEGEEAEEKECERLDAERELRSKWI